MVDSIPIRLAPLPGEDLDSYLHAYAHRLHAEVSDILALALAPGWGQGADHGQRPWAFRLAPHDRDVLAALTGLPAQTLTDMTLARYQNTGLVRSAARSRPRWWLTFRGSRFCPDCLAANGGRWMLAWRLPWTFACTHHHRLLAANCDACGRLHRPAVHRPAQASGCCDTTGLPLPARMRRPQLPGCTVPLADTITITLDPHGAVLTAQEHVNSLIDTLVDTTTNLAAAARQRLDDLHAAARAALLVLTAPPPPPDTVTAVLTDLHADSPNVAAYLRDTNADRRRPNGIAAGVTIAHLMLAGPPGDPDPAITDWLIDAAANRGETGPMLLLRRWKNTSPDLHGALLKRLTPHLDITRQLRYGTSATTPRPPQAGDGRDRAVAVPALFWRGWALRLNPQGLLDSLSYRTTLSALFLLAGTNNLGYQDALRLLGHTPTSGAYPAPTIARLRDAGVLHTVTAALGDLAAALDAHGSPIDYGRRRRWKRFTAPAFDEHAWRRHCTQTRARRLTSPRQTTFARLYLAELLTAVHPHSLPPPARLTARDRPDYANFVRRLPTTQDDYLHHQARRVLSQANIREPVEWEPPFDWISPIRWPGPDPATTPRGDQWARTPVTIHAASASPPRPPSTEQLRAYLAQGLSPRQIAKATRTPHPLISQLLAQTDFARPAAPDVLAALDPAWLRREYEQNQRTLHHLAAELGIDRHDLSIYARSIGIAVRRGRRPKPARTHTQ